MRRLTLAWSLVVFTLSAASGQVYQTRSGHVEFTSSVPLHKFTGESDHLTGRINLADSTVDFYVDLNTLDTGNGKRDKDMRETLETDEHPFAEFFGKLASSFDTTTSQDQKVTVQGTFTLHGVERELEVRGTMAFRDGHLHVAAGWELRLDDYNIEPPSLLIIKVDEVQQIRIDAKLQPVES